MNANTAWAWVDALFFTRTGTHLNELQQAILQGVWQGQPYTQIAQHYGCTEGHAKDMGANLWKMLSDALGEKVTKRSYRTVLMRYASWAEHSGQETLPALDLIATDHKEALHFVGREAAIAHLNALVQKGCNTVVLQGEGGLGKTTLAQQYLKLQNFEVVLELLMAKETSQVTSVQGVVEDWLKRDLNEEPGREFGVTLARLKRHLQRQRIGILIDNLEPALDREGRLIAEHRAYGELLRILSDSQNQSLTLITSRDRLCEEGLTVEHYRLPRLAVEAWANYWSRHDIQSDSMTLNHIHQSHGGNAKAMQILCGTIREDYEGDAIAYWRDHCHDPLHATVLKNLIVSQVERLKFLDDRAYQLLCRLGCYRFQSIATVTQSGLQAMLWDVEPESQGQVIQSLRNRSLVEYHRGHYWLHPAIRSVAIAHLKAGQDWEKSSRQAADYWTHLVEVIATLSDALRAWEAFYHYVAIQDYEAASQVILKSRHNQWQQHLPLGSFLYRMGLSQLVLSAIHQIIESVQCQSNQSELYNILGDLHWITGQIHPAIAHQSKSLAIASDCLQTLSRQTDQLQSREGSSFQHQRYYFRMLKIDSLLSLGLYHFDLWELEKAEALFAQVIELGQNTEHNRWAEKAQVCLALVKSWLGDTTQARALADPIYKQVQLAQSSAYGGRFAYFIQKLGQTYGNLGLLEDAQELYQKTIAYAEESDYVQLQGMGLSGFAEVKRGLGHRTIALKYHRKAVRLLESSGAQCDLATAQMQWGITLAPMLEQEASVQFNQAMERFAAIGASRQVERVKQLLPKLA